MTGREKGGRGEGGVRGSGGRQGRRDEGQVGREGTLHLYIIQGN